MLHSLKWNKKKGKLNAFFYENNLSFAIHNHITRILPYINEKLYVDIIILDIKIVSVHYTHTITVFNLKLHTLNTIYYKNRQRKTDDTMTSQPAYCVSHNIRSFLSARVGSLYAFPKL